MLWQLPFTKWVDHFNENTLSLKCKYKREERTQQRYCIYIFEILAHKIKSFGKNALQKETKYIFSNLSVEIEKKNEQKAKKGKNHQFARVCFCQSSKNSPKKSP